MSEIASGYEGITFADIQRGLRGEFPKSAKKRKALGLEIWGKARVCPTCGEVHISKRCTAKRRRTQKLFNLPLEELKKMLEEREQFK